MSAPPRARLPDGNMPLINRSGNVTERFCFSALLLALVGIDGCGPSSVCAGDISCLSKSGDLCAAIPGCKSVPGCIHYGSAHDANCATVSSQASCLSQHCAWIDSECQSVCLTIASESVCDSYFFEVSVGPNMTVAVTPCVWSQCSGIPDTPNCGHYSSEMCPTNLGCKVQQTCSWGDC